MASYGSAQYAGTSYGGSSAGSSVNLIASIGFEATIGSGAITIARQLSSATSLVLGASSTLDVHTALTSTVTLDARLSGTLALFGVPLSSNVAFDTQVVGGLFSVSQTGVAPPTAANYRLAVVDRQGVLYGWLPRAEITKVGWRLNDPAETTFELSSLDPSASLLPMATFPNREIQVWRKRTDKPLWWGRPLHPNAGKEKLSWTAKDLLSWFGTRYIGKPKRDYLAPYGGFDLDAEGTFPPTGWTRHGIESPDAAIVINNQVSGGKSVQVNSDADDRDAYIEHIVGGITGPSPTAPYVASVWFYTAPEHWIGPAFGALGLMVQACAADDSVLNAYWDGGLVEDSVELGTWQRLVVICGRPAGMSYYRFRLYIPGGWSVYDDAQLVLPESLSFQKADLGDMLESLSQYAQDPSLLKSNLNIGRSHVTTGRQVNRTWHFEDHPNHLAAAQEYAGVEAGTDFSVDYSDAHTRTFTVHWPRQGTTRTTTLRYSTAASPASNCSDFSLSIDGETIATSVTELGPGSGPEREEAVALDTTALDGLVLEMLENLPAGSGIGELLARAKQRVGQAKTPVVALTLTTADASLVDDWENGDLGLGDTINAAVDWGWVQIAEPMRLVACDLDPKMEALTLTLNVDPIATVMLTNPSDQHAAWLGGVAGRVSTLERKPSAAPLRPVPLWQVFNLTGPLTVSAGDPWTVPTSRMLSQVTVDLTASGSTATVVTVYRDGVSVGTVTVPAYATSFTQALVVPYKAGSTIMAGVTTVGTGAAGIVITPETVLAQAA